MDAGDDNVTPHRVQQQCAPASRTENCEGGGGCSRWLGGSVLHLFGESDGDRRPLAGQQHGVQRTRNPLRNIIRRTAIIIGELSVQVYQDRAGHFGLPSVAPSTTLGRSHPNSRPSDVKEGR